MTGIHPSFSIIFLQIFIDLQAFIALTPNLIHYPNPPSLQFETQHSEVP